MDEIFFVNSASFNVIEITSSLIASQSAIIDFRLASYVSGTFKGDGSQLTDVTASFIQAGSNTTSSYSLKAESSVSSSWSSSSISASYAGTAAFLYFTASISNGTASAATTSSHAVNALTASHALNALTSSHALNALSSSYSSTASNAIKSISSSVESILFTGSFANFFITYVQNTGSQQLYIDTGSIKYNPSASILTVNNVSASTITTTGDVNIAGNCTVDGGTLNFNENGLIKFYPSRCALRSPADGQIVLENSIGTDFGRIQFGGTSATFPALRRAGNGLDVVSADNTIFTNLHAGSITVETTVTANNVTGSLFGTASNSISSSYANNVPTKSLFSRGGAFYDAGGLAGIQAAGQNLIIWRAPFSCSATTLNLYRVTGSEAFVNARRNGTGTLLTASLTSSVSESWIQCTTFQTSSFADGDKLEIMLITSSGYPTQIAIQIDFTRP